jgi:hypothetical protein
MTKSKIVVVFPVFNGARTLEKSLQCIADQDFTGFIVSRILFFRMCWNDARRKTRYKLFWIF